jgi:DNA invertase Pin-like site-specific DNA recombinase
MRDEGLSAYHQKHVKAGAVGVFLRAVEDGKVPPGSVLIVEQLDRLSRAEPILAQGQMSAIIGAGVRIVTAADGREYSREILKKDPMGLVYSLLTMIRAHEESDTKSKRSKGAIVARCRQWLAGTYRGYVGAPSTDPGWVTRTPDGFVVQPERAAAIRLAIELYQEGHGGLRVVQELHRRGLSLGAGPTGPNRVLQILAKRSLFGEKEVAVDGETFRLPEYYPPILTEDEWQELQHLAEQRGRRAGKGEIPGLRTGLGVAFCGYCGAPVVGQNNMTQKRRGDGTLRDGNRRVVCMRHRTGMRCPVGGSCSVVPIEHAIMAYCSDAMNLTCLLAGDSGETARVAALARARAIASATQAQIDKLMSVLLDDPGAAPAAFATKVRELEERLKPERAEVERLERELAVAGSATPAAAERWAELADGVQRLDYDARTHTRQLVADSFSKIAVYRQGFSSVEDDGTIGLLLIGKRGSTRMLNIDRRTGMWTASADIDTSGDIPIPTSAIGV